MTGKEFLKWVQGYYAPYPVGQQMDIVEYISKQPNDFLDALKQVLIKRYSSEYRRAPDVAIFEKLATEASASMIRNLPLIEAPRDSEEYQNLVKLSHEARQRGIDPTVEGWLVRLMFDRMKEKGPKEASL